MLAELKLRYQNSILGYLWSFIKPLAMFAILYIVFVYVFNVGGSIPHYAPYLLLGIVMWSFFSEVTTVSVTSIVAKGDLLRKINLPKYTIILSATASAFINLILNLTVVFVLMAINGVGFSWGMLIAPVIFLQLLLFSVSCGLILGAAYVRLRDINFIWEVFLQALFYATPVIYPVGLLSQKHVLVAKILLLNPLAQIVQDARYLLITKDTVTISSLYDSQWIRVVPYALTLLLFGFSIYFFHSRSSKFAEEV